MPATGPDATQSRRLTPSPAANPARPGEPLAPAGGLSLPQVLGSALAAATAAFAASFLGVAGTVVGAVVGSVVATIGSAIYAHSLRTAGTRLRTVRGEPVAQDAAPERRHRLSPVPGAGPRRLTAPRGVLRLGAGVLVGAGLALGAITGVERVLGHPLSGSATAGTSIGQVVSSSLLGVPAPAPPAAVTVPTDTATGPASAATPSLTTSTASGSTSTGLPTSIRTSAETSSPTVRATSTGGTAMAPSGPTPRATSPAPSTATPASPAPTGPGAPTRRTAPSPLR